MPDANTKWDNQEGSFITKYKAKVEFCLPKLNLTKIMTWKFYVDDSDTR